jgi:hypothetical protein
MMQTLLCDRTLKDMTAGAIEPTRTEQPASAWMKRRTKNAQAV